MLPIPVFLLFIAQSVFPLEQQPTKTIAACENARIHFSNRNCNFSDGGMCIIQCGHFTFTHFQHDSHEELTVEHLDQFNDVGALQALRINVGDYYQEIVLKCNYGGSLADILEALNVTQLDKLTIQAAAKRFKESSLKNFNKLPFSLRKLQFQELRPSAPRLIPSEGFASLDELTLVQTKMSDGFIDLLTNLTTIKIMDNDWLLNQPTDLFRQNASSLKYISITGIIGSANFSSSNFMGFPRLRHFEYHAATVEDSIVTFFNDTFNPCPNLENLTLENAWMLPDNDLKAIRHLGHLQMLNLTRMRLDHVGLEDIPKSLTEFWLQEHDFECQDCDTVIALVDLKARELLKTELTLRCDGSSETPLTRVKDTYCPGMAILVVPIAVGVIGVVIVAIILAYYYRKCTGERLSGGEEQEYDAFISFEDSDEAFANDILEELEVKNDFNCIIHTRDFLPGEYITTNIARAVQNSRTVIIVLSKTFLASPFCNHELTLASDQGRRILVVMRVGEMRPSKEELSDHPVIQLHVNAFTYLKEEDPKFKEKLAAFVQGGGHWFWNCGRGRRRKKDHLELKQADP